jgi:dihydrodipicolinate synthase/N-acetylneuraminate lyase
MGKLSGRHENFKSAKTGGGTWLDFYELITGSPDLVHFVTEPAFKYCFPLGKVGLIPSSNYLFPNYTRRYFDAVTSGDHALAQECHLKLVRFFSATAVPLVGKGYIDGAIDKAYAKLGGHETGLELKSPYQCLSAEDYSWLEDLVHREFKDLTNY